MKYFFTQHMMILSRWSSECSEDRLCIWCWAEQEQCFSGTDVRICGCCNEYKTDTICWYYMRMCG